MLGLSLVGIEIKCRKNYCRETNSRKQISFQFNKDKRLWLSPLSLLNEKLLLSGMEKTRRKKRRSKLILFLFFFVFIFFRFDVGADGFLDLMELKIMMEKLGAPQTHIGLKAMIAEVDEDNDGKISFREFMLIYRY